MSISRTLPAGDVMRARMILMLAAGRSYLEIQRQLETTAPRSQAGRNGFKKIASMD
jgi:hypothetical protein